VNSSEIKEPGSMKLLYVFTLFIYFIYLLYLFTLFTEKKTNTKPSGLLGPDGTPLPLVGVNIRAKVVCFLPPLPNSLHFL
jgi:hypothetical protein